jgi:hypothetical protein
MVVLAAFIGAFASWLMIGLPVLRENQLYAQLKPLATSLQEARSQAARALDGYKYDPTAALEVARNAGQGLRAAADYHHGSTRVITEETAALMEELAPIHEHYLRRYEELQQVGGLDLLGFTSSGQILEREQSLKRYCEAVALLADRQSNMLAHLEKRLRDVGVPEEAIQKQVADENVVRKQRLLSQARQADLRLCTAAQALMGKLRSTWGRWQYSEDGEIIEFLEDDDLAMFQAPFEEYLEATDAARRSSAAMLETMP